MSASRSTAPCCHFDMTDWRWQCLVRIAVSMFTRLSMDVVILPTDQCKALAPSRLHSSRARGCHSFLGLPIDECLQCASKAGLRVVHVRPMLPRPKNLLPPAQRQGTPWNNAGLCSFPTKRCQLSRFRMGSSERNEVLLGDNDVSISESMKAQEMPRLTRSNMAGQDNNHRLYHSVSVLCHVFPASWKQVTHHLARRLCTSGLFWYRVSRNMLTTLRALPSLEVGNV